MQAHYRLKSGKIFLCFLALLHGLALLLVWVTDYAVPFALALSFLLMFSLYRHVVHRRRLDGRRAFDAFLLAGDRINFYVGDEPVYQGLLGHATLVTSYLILFHVRVDGRRIGRRVLLLRDELDAQAYRQLCVSLRMA